MITINEVEPDEQCELISIVNNFHGYFTSKEIDLVTELINSYFNGNKDRYIIKVAKDSISGKISGFIIYKNADLSENYFDIYWLIVSPEFHNKKVGTTILKNIEEEIKQKNAYAILIETSSSSKFTSARHLYEKMGYKEICRIENYYSKNESKIIYRKIIDKL